MSRSLVFAVSCLCLCCGVGCAVPNAHLSALPVYETPGGFSETYHAALKRQEPALWPAGEGVPVSYTAVEPVTVEPAAVARPATPLRPPMEW